MGRGRGIFQFQGTERARLDALPDREDSRDVPTRTVDGRFGNGVPDNGNAAVDGVRCFRFLAAPRQRSN